MFETGLKAGGVTALEADGSNFVEWLDLVKKALLSKDLWKYAIVNVICKPFKAEH